MREEFPTPIPEKKPEPAAALESKDTAKISSVQASALEKEAVVESHPELARIQRAFSEGAISVYEEKDEDLDVVRKKTRIDQEKLKTFFEKDTPLSDAREAEVQKRIERTPLPPQEEMEKLIQSTLDEVKTQLGELDVLPRDFSEKEKSLSPLKLSYDQDKKYGRYLDYKYFHDPADGEAPSAVIDIGGKHIQHTATRVRDELRKIGVSVNVDESIRMVTTHMVAHEYGHRISDAYAEDITKQTLDGDNIRAPHPFYAKIATLGRDNPLRLNDVGEKEGILEEQLGQSFAHNVLVKNLTGRGYDDPTVRAVSRILGADKKGVQEYKDFLLSVEKMGLDSTDVQRALNDTQEQLGPESEEAKKLEFELRAVGYDLEPFDLDQLRYITRTEK